MVDQIECHPFFQRAAEQQPGRLVSAADVRSSGRRMLVARVDTGLLAWKD
jgi:hypothetical protein